MEITKADELKELTELGQAEFEKSVLEGPLFKSILASMEDSAMKGYSGFKKTIYDVEDLRDYYVIQKAFQNAGYECEIEIERKTTFFNVPYTNRLFRVSWDNDKK